MTCARVVVCLFRAALASAQLVVVVTSSCYRICPDHFVLTTRLSPARLQRKLIALGVVGMVCRIAARADKLVYPEAQLPPMLNAVRAERREQLTLQLRESIRKSCAAALGNLSYIRSVSAYTLPTQSVCLSALPCFVAHAITACILLL